MSASLKVVVAHPAKQHSYRLATALDRAEVLGCYATTVYMKPRSLTKAMSRLLPSRWGRKAARENGFVVPVQDAGALRERIEWFLGNRAELPRMARRSRELVQSRTWDDYYANVAAAVARLAEKGRLERL